MDKRLIESDLGEIEDFAGFWQAHMTSESESELLCDWHFIEKQFVLTPSPFKLTKKGFSFQLNPYGDSPYVTSSQ
jgi:hypothetical protein